MPLIFLASFKNSRVYGRKATTSSVTADGVIPASSGPALLIAGADENRTYLGLRNLSAVTGDNIRYGYATGGVVPSLAFLLSDGFVLKPGEVVNDLESPEAVYAVSESLNTIPYCIDKGVG